jgi:hypothetical protein
MKVIHEDVTTIHHTSILTSAQFCHISVLANWRHTTEKVVMRARNHALGMTAAHNSHREGRNVRFEYVTDMVYIPLPTVIFGNALHFKSIAV